jgi:NAD+ diphosphatase
MSGSRLAKSTRNVFSSGALDRASEWRTDGQQVQALLQDSAARFAVLWKNKNLVITTHPVSPAFLTKAQADSLMPDPPELVFLGILEGVPYFAFALPEGTGGEARLPEGTEFKDLREIGALLPRDEGSVLAYVRALMHWHHTHRYCGKCGSKTVVAEAGHVRQCTTAACGLKHFPRTDAAIIVLITHGESCLLVRQPPWPPGMHAVVAGFLEPGESLEDAVAREAMEETGIALTHIRYHSSQPWPFPASIMVGFTARARSMNFTLDGHEIEAACWLTREQLVQRLKDKTIKLPSALSISYRLIEDWFAQKNGASLSQIS